MIKKNGFAFGVLLTMTVINLQCLAQNVPMELPDQWQQGSAILLFDGQGLDAWYTFVQHRGRNNDPQNVFRVENGILVISGEEWGCITTKNPYDNYILKTMFRWTGETFGNRKTKARDSGILIHSQGMDGGYGGIWMHGIEIQIIEGGTGDFIVVGDGSTSFGISSPVATEKQGNSFVFAPDGPLERIHGGRINWYGRSPDWKDSIDFRGARDVEKPVGEWNDLEIHSWEGNISVYLNGKLVNFATQVKPAHGRIQVQSEGATIAFKEILLYPLIKN